jgi:hypothetical protein
LLSAVQQQQAAAVILVFCCILQAKAPPPLAGGSQVSQGPELTQMLTWRRLAMMLQMISHRSSGRSTKCMLRWSE